MGKKKGITARFAERIAERDGSWRCHYCGVETVRSSEIEKHAYERAIPLKKVLEWCPFFEQLELGKGTRIEGDYVIETEYPKGIEDRITQVDHVVPVCAGGRDEMDNLVIACRRCNNRKRDMDYFDFIALLMNEQQEARHA